MVALKCQSQNENTTAKSKTQQQITKYTCKQENTTTKQKYDKKGNDNHKKAKHGHKKKKHNCKKKTKQQIDETQLQKC